MTTRARELLNRSRALLGGPRAAASQLLGPQPPRPGLARPATPAGVGARAEAPSRDGLTTGRSPARPTEAEEALAAICADLALRDLNLVDSLLAQLEGMESREEDADRLSELYRLDHLAARLRRNAENLRVLAGRDAGDSTSDTLSLVDVIRGAMSSIDYYQRVTVGRVVSLGVVGFAAEDVSRLVAELLDNATKSSPPHSPVRIGAHLTEQGSALLRIEDEGIGLPPERLSQLNARLEAEPVLDDDAVRHMGLAVVRRLAARYEIRTWLDHRHPHGTTASVLLPAPLISELSDAGWSGLRTVVTPSPASGAGPVEAPLAEASSGNGNGAVASLPGRKAANGRAGSRAAAAAAGVRDARPVGADGGQAGGRTDSVTGPMLASAAPGTTASGLPRRVSHSLREPRGKGGGAPVAAAGPGGAPGTAGAPAPTEADVRAGHQKLLADLGAFSEGEQAALDELRRD
ncbi:MULTISPECIES: sensor histidine kinase KdpD [unclassified Pseudofrankia]|uniref:sensor histidine kinase n=1 Tax=unclassified Pseudofrankia TaxID=2994372 RepID=UPI0008DB3350|nr:MULTISPECIES: ATP-binding protein [unclassified Pseudofrankia]MDT3440411.1 ATP-binding protein [Pseudofrankia sp. BMG5.37]OHV47574.1 histidine kinase [Pseudofrankia sp. BMG5.36]